MKSTPKKPPQSSSIAGYHKIKSVELTGGFLDGARFELDDELNCIIGGRGTGKTSVLEAIRFALDRMPDESLDRARYQAIDKLIEHNIGDGRVRIEIETRDGVAYTVTRSHGEPPRVVNADGKTVDINLRKDLIFGVDIYSQNQIEDIANDAFFQLQLIDKFISRDVDDLDRQIQETTKSLESNAAKVLEAKRAIDDLLEATRELPDIAEKIRAFEKRGASGGEVLRREHELNALRDREVEVAAAVRALYARGIEELAETARGLHRQCEDAFESDFAASPNRELFERMRDRAETAIEDVERSLKTAANALGTATEELKGLVADLAGRHGVQEKQYRELVDKHEQERAKGAERTRLEQRHAELRAKEKKLGERRAAMRTLDKERQQLRAKISDLRDQRFRLRVGVAERLNEQLEPMIRVRVDQFGNRDEYRHLLNQAMKGSGMRYATIVDRAVERVPPAELAAMIQSEDLAGLSRELDLDADRATRVVIQLKDKPEIFAIETVELHDRPLLELRDGEDYKDSSSLSTGQKCTAILPILLIESERPLLIDQPEDNLDNAFVFETIVGSLRAVRGRRQLLFVTHNPNIPVLGDAACVFALQSTGRSASLGKMGTVDDVAAEIMTILEGGWAAFEARRERYGRPAPEKRAR
jgi:DNA repair ATPase RecN